MSKIDKYEASDRIHTVDDEKKRLIDFWDMNIPVPEVGIQDAPTRCYEINLEWAKIVMGLVSWLADIAAWKEAQHENYTPIQEILKFLQGSDCVDCDAVAACFNQNPDWISFQNFTLTQMAETTDEFLAELENLYDGSNANSINPLIPSDEPDLASEENALCYAIGAWVRLYCEAKETKIRQSSFLSQAWNALQNAIEGAYGVISNVTGFNLLDDLFACFVDNNEALTALNDEAAISDVICCLYGELKDLVLTTSAFEAAIATCLGSLMDNAHDILCLISNDLNLQHTLNFYYIYGRALERQLQNEVLGCECDSWLYSYLDFDFSYGSHGFTVTNGSYVNGQYFEGTELDPDPDNNSLQVLIIDKFLVPDYRVCGIGIVYDSAYDCGTPGTSVNARNDGVNVGGGSLNPSGNNAQTHRTWSFSNRTSGVVSDQIRVDVRSQLCSGVAAISRIYRVRVWIAEQSAVHGIPSDTAPQGLPANGSTDMVWWQ